MLLAPQNSAAGVSVGHNGSILSCPKLQTWQTRQIKRSHSKTVANVVSYQSFLTPNKYSTSFKTGNTRISFLHEIDGKGETERARASEPAVAVLGRLSSKLWI